MKMKQRRLEAWTLRSGLKSRELIIAFDDGTCAKVLDDYEGFWDEASSFIVKNKHRLIETKVELYFDPVELYGRHKWDKLCGRNGNGSNEKCCKN